MGSVKRVPAKEIELAISKALITEAGRGAGASNLSELTRADFERLIVKVEVRKNQLAIQLRTVPQDQVNAEECATVPSKPKVLLVPWKKASVAREIIRPAGDPARREKPIKARPRAALI